MGNIVSTPDLNFAAYIWAKGHKKYSWFCEPELDRFGNEKRKFVFEFKDLSIEEFNELKQSYYDGTGMVSVQEYVAGQRHFRNLCFMR
jgi:hypothetical protein